MNPVMHQAVRDNFIEKASYVALITPGMSVADYGSFVAVDCGLPSDTFNVVARRVLTSSQLLQDGVGHFMSKKFPMALWYWEHPQDRQGMSALSTYGLAQTETHHAMYADLNEVRIQPRLPVGLKIHAATQADNIRRFGAVIAELFGNSDEGRHVAAYHAMLGEVGMS